MKSDNQLSAFQVLERYGRLMLLKAYQEMGVFRHNSEKYKADELVKHLGIIPDYYRLNEALLEILQKAGFINLCGGMVSATPELDNAELLRELAGLAGERHRIAGRFEQIGAYVDLLRACMERYPDILKGRISATDVIFPNSSMSLVEPVYKGNVYSDRFNRLVAGSVKLYIENRIPRMGKNEKIKIIEIGAGTGGTSALTVDMAKAYGEYIQYVYTDISPAFVLYGENTYGSEYPFMDFKVLDIEKDIEDQDVNAGSFDMAIAANVLHATRRMDNTVQNVKKLLKKNGWLILNELTDALEFSTLTFGLLEGWWLFEDKEIRIKGSPLLSRESWRKLLGMEGFKNIMFLGERQDSEVSFDQSVIIAESDGAIKVKISSSKLLTEELRRDAGRTVEEDGSPVPEISKDEAGSDIEQFVEDELTEIITGMLRLKKDKFNTDISFWDYGVDSILVGQIISSINLRLNIRLKNQDLFNYSTIRKLTGYIVEKHGDTIVQALSDNLFQKSPENAYGIVPDEGDAQQGEDASVKPENIAGDIAVIGMSCRFPGARNIDEYWENIAAGKDCITEIPEERWDPDLYYDPRPDTEGRYNCRYGGFIADVDKFEPLFFNISPKQAELMEPRHRLFLQEAWRAIEDAGYSKQQLEGKKCGVFVGCEGDSEYLKGKIGKPEEYNSHLFLGNSNSVLASRISYFMDLKGPSVTVDTACSSSLVAIHLACDSIRNGTCDMAIAGGVHVIVKPEEYVILSSMGMLSPDGRCKAFDDSANGFVPAEGVGVVLLKPLYAALRDGDNIYGVIIGSGINQDGKSNGITAPNMLSQCELEYEVYKKCGISPESIGYIEAHGTGTKLGDPIEFDALANAFRRFTNKKHFCSIGSVKTNIGHTGPAAGAAGLIKILLQLKNGFIAPNLHFGQINRQIELDDSPFFISTRLQEWKREGNRPRRAAVSSFGHSGTNCHMVVEEAPEVKRNLQPVPCCLFAVSADTDKAMEQKIDDLVAWLERRGTAYPVEDISYTLLNGRSHFSIRLAIVAESADELVQKLKLIRSGDVAKDCYRADNGKACEKPEKSLQELGKRIIAELNAFKSPAAEEFKAKLLVLADLYTKGYEMDWALLYEGHGCRRIPMPTYPFGKERYWLLGKENPTAAQMLDKCIIYGSTWEISGDRAAAGADALPGSLLIFDRNDGLTDVIKDKLRQRGIPDDRIYLVRAGECFQKPGRRVFEINPGSPGDYSRLIEELKTESFIPEAIVHLWSEIGLGFGADNLEKQLEKSIYSVFCLSRYLMEKHLCDTAKLIYVYPGGKNKVFPHYAAVAAFAKTVRLENPKLICKTVEIGSSLSKEAEAEAVFRELGNGLFSDVQVCYEEGCRLVRKYRTIDISIENTESTRLRKDGVYLVTGGAGGLGFIFAEYLAKKSGGKIVLAGRSGMSDEISAKLDRIRGLGAEAIYLQSDISVKEEAERLVEQIRDRFGGINGVIHSAGIYRNGFVIRKTADDMKDVLAPKVFGTVNLDEATKDDELDFFAMFSSISALSGKVGQSDYTYANSFLDFFAQMRESLRREHKRRGRTISINWPYWAGGGMHISPEERQEIFEQFGIEPMPAKAGLRCWETAFSSEMPQYIVFYGNSKEKIDWLLNNRFEREPEKPENKREFVDHSLLWDNTEALVKSVLADETGIPANEIDPDITFDRYGFDSIVINHFNSKMSSKIRNIPKTILYECNTLRELTEYLVKNHRAELTELFALNGGNYAETAVEHPAKEMAVQKGNEIRCTVQDNEKLISSIAQAGAGKEDIAVIGVSGRYPGARDLDEFWENLCAGKDCVREIPIERWDYRSFYDPDPAKASEGKIYCKWGSFLEDIDKFDPMFFNISPREAETMDPQERLFLETVWAALEDAGYTRNEIRELVSSEKRTDIGVFVGVTSNSYQLLGQNEWRKGNMVIPAAMHWSIANRVSYILNLYGPSFPVDTACSSSLTALHLACESLRKNECSMAIAGGVNLQVHFASRYLYLCQLGMLSKGGKCRSFGKGGDGFVPGEGVGAVILKPLSYALRDRDQIYAVIKGTAVNHGGRTNGYTVPNPNAQADLIRQALKNAGVDARTIGYIEAHGTGTSLGDPIEIAGITKAYREYTDDRQYCAIGSIKSNIGHLESAAGIAGLTKIILQLKHKKLVPSLHAERLNPNINFEESPVYVQKELTEWRQIITNEGGRSVPCPRRAAISGFGAGGANAHIILEEYTGTMQETGTSGSRPCLAVLSARNRERLVEYAKKIIDFLEACENPDRHADNGNPSISEYVTAEVRAISDKMLSAGRSLAKDIDEMQRVLEVMERYGRCLLASVLVRKGIITEKGSVSKEALKGRLKIVPEYERLFEALLEILANAGFVKYDRSTATLISSADIEKTGEEIKLLSMEKRSLEDKLPGIAAMFRLLDVCLENCLDVISGQKGYADVMFPGGSMSLVEGIYKGNCVTDHFNSLAAQAVKSYIRQRIERDQSAKIRIVEIGAGTGGTSAFVLEEIKRYSANISYVYTDISLGFTQHGKRTFSGRYPFVEFKKLDIESDPAKQGFEQEAFDLALASNVIHATKNINETLGNIRKLLKPRGMLVLNEVTKVQEYGTLTYGLTNGWWAFEDTGHRLKNSPLLSAEKWSELLYCNKFEKAEVIRLPVELGGRLEYSLILGEKRGYTNGGNCIDDITYTMQTGREAMRERLAVLASGCEELKNKLKGYISGESGIEGLYTGRSADKRTARNAAGKELNIAELIAGRELDKIAQLWVAGEEINWKLLYRDHVPRRVSIPTYPFARDRYWLPQAEDPAGKEIYKAVGRLHPLIDKNTSDLEEQRYTLSVTGKEFYLSDHVIGGKKIFPGAAYIEMAFAAGKLACRQKVSKLSNIVWTSPIAVDEAPDARARDINISLNPAGKDVEFAVWTENEDGERTVHAYGKLSFAADNRQVYEPERVDIESVKNRCKNHMSSKDCYRNFLGGGFRYGPSFRPVTELYYDEEKSLARLELPLCLKQEFSEFILHPSLMDGAFQAVLGLAIDEELAYVPFCMGEVEVIKPFGRICYALAARSRDRQDAGVKKFDIDILDEKGEILVRIKDFSMRALRQFNNLENAAANDCAKLMFCHNVWEDRELKTR